MLFNRFLGILTFSILIFLFIITPEEGKGSDLSIPDTVRVRLVEKAPLAGFQVTGNYQLIEKDTGNVIAGPKPGENWQVGQPSVGQPSRLTEEQGRLLLKKGSETVGTFQGPLVLKENEYRLIISGMSGVVVEKYSGSGLYLLGAKGESRSMQDELSSYWIQSASDVGALNLTPLQLKKHKGLNLVTLINGKQVRHFRGNMEFRLDDEGITAVNELPLEQYLYGVVPSEMPSSWPLEALKAQAVAARSFTSTLLSSSSRGYELLPTQLNQVYGGYDVEKPLTTCAVDETRGLIMTYEGKPASAFYHSSSGGVTENSEDVWLNPLPYIRGKNDPWDKNDKHYNWSVTYSVYQLRDQLYKKGYQFKEVIDLKELEKTSSGLRVKKIEVTGTDSNDQTVIAQIYNADRVRVALGLKSALFQIVPKYNEENHLVEVRFNGSGWGHGLGMSQYGALALAQQGYNYQDILKYYYTGINIGN